MSFASVGPAGNSERTDLIVSTTSSAASPTVRSPFTGLAAALNNGTDDQDTTDTAEDSATSRPHRKPGQGADLVAASDPATVARLVAERIEGYEPRRPLGPGEWEVVGPVLRELVAQARPPHPDLAVNWLMHTLGLLVWAHRQRMPLRADVLLRPSTLNRYLDGQVTAGSRPTVASMLRRVAAGMAHTTEHQKQHPGQGCDLGCPPPPDARAQAAHAGGRASAAARQARRVEDSSAEDNEPTGPLTAARAAGLARPNELSGLLAVTDHPAPASDTPLSPYTPAQVAELLRATRTLRTRHQRDSAAAAILLGAGAGLDGRDAPLLRPPHLTWTPSATGPVLVAAVPGLRARRVALLAGTADLLADIAERTADDRFLLGGGPRRANRFT